MTERSNLFLTVNKKLSFHLAEKNKNNSNFRFEGVLFLNMILDQGEALVVAKARNQQLRILHEKLQQCTTAA